MRCWAWWSANRYSRNRERDYHSICISNDSEPFTSRDDDNSSVEAEGKDPPDDPPITDAHVYFDDDMYDSVTMAAFGGVHLQLPGGTVRVHPMWLCLGCLPLFAAQQASLLYMRLGQELEKPVHGEGVSDELKQILPFAKTLMVYTLGLMLFPELLGACRLLLFVLNPTTWIDIKRFRPEKKAMWAFLWSTPVLVSCAATAELLKLSIGYVVLIDSVSVVLVCDTVQHVRHAGAFQQSVIHQVFPKWRDVVQVFGIEYKEQMQNLQLMTDEEQEIKRKEGNFKREAGASAMSVHSGLSPICRGLGGGSAVEALLVPLPKAQGLTKEKSGLMCVMLYSLKTDTLPVASLGAAVLAPGKSRIKRNQTCNPEVGGYCSDQFRAITGRDMWDLAMERPLLHGHISCKCSTWLTCAKAGMVCVLLVPQIFQLLLFCETDRKDCAALQKQAATSRKEMDSLNDKVEEIRMRLNLVCGTSRMVPQLLPSQADLSEAKRPNILKFSNGDHYRKRSNLNELTGTFS
ncbi:hypothetical protein AK812_SmicGene15307 [Symbiodinium microadriaticum]|uniref:Uncharacterized protein n=1 Tax=Symbiodinium microadriaticum TaxID=2951 RepID=A0A1Q9E3E2_SYMMI|nr:hypothetical protein AK812_SmicGene15307 [Symbiodinium microadriaticum]